MYIFLDDSKKKPKNKTKSKAEDKQPLITPAKKNDKIFNKQVPLQSCEMVFIFHSLKH